MLSQLGVKLADMANYGENDRKIKEQVVFHIIIIRYLFFVVKGYQYR